MGIDWRFAPYGSEFYAHGKFRREDLTQALPVVYNRSKGWIKGIYTLEECQNSEDYQRKPKQWPETEERIDIISTNGGDGLHYDQQREERERRKEAPRTSVELLNACISVQTERGKQYDASGAGERSFAAAAAAFNAATGKSLTGSDVCLLLTMVKLVRQYSSPDRLHQDSLLDGVSYLSLWAEELTNELGA